MSVRPDLFRRLREGTEVLRTGGGANLYAGECDAVLNLIEAAQHWKEINDKSEERGVSQDTGTFIAWQDFCEALSVVMDESC